jgi:hypothetical protein
MIALYLRDCNLAWKRQVESPVYLTEILPILSRRVVETYFNSRNLYSKGI